MSRRSQFLCGTPNEHCTGGILHTDQVFRAHKSHASRAEAFRCYKRYLVRVRGMAQLSSRTFQTPEGPIQILPKRSKFGGRLRMGKEGSRYEPESGKGGGSGSGLIF